MTLLLLIRSSMQTLTWSDIGSIMILVILEAILSADNAVALAALVKHLPPVDQKRALRWGMVGAYGLRILLILTSTWFMRILSFRLAGAAYLLWLAGQHFWSNDVDETQRMPGNANLWQTILLVEFTDLMFSLDSVTTSLALSSKTSVIILAGLLGITLMRYMAGYLLRCLDKFVRLEDAAYSMILLMGGRMVLDCLVPSLNLPEWSMVIPVFGLLLWGFSKRRCSIAMEFNPKEIVNG
jgi:YkoY family integral membrane protein